MVDSLVPYRVHRLVSRQRSVSFDPRSDRVRTLTRSFGLALMLGVSALLAACGGGGGDAAPASAPAVTTPAVTKQPASQTVTPGASVTFDVVATGNGLAYQWQRSTTGGVSWQSISGATSQSYAITPVDATMNGDQYHVIIQNPAGMVVSEAATLTVTSPPAGGGNGGTTSIVSLPADLLARPAAAGCAALRSGDFNLMTPTVAGPLAQQWERLRFDAATMTSTRSDGSTATWSDNGGDCRFRAQGATYSADVAVTQAGVIAGTLTRNGVTRLFLGVPAQTHTLVDLAGTWNVMGVDYSSANAALLGSAGTTTLNDSGRYVSGVNCRLDATWAINNCVTVDPSVLALVPTLTAESDGGFAMTDFTGMTTRLFAYRAGSGDLMVAVVSLDGNFALYTPDRSIPLPEIGSVNENWNYDANGQFVAYPVSQSSNTVTAVDAAAGTYTRVARTNGGTRETTSTLFANNPRRGYVFRPAAVVTASDGTQVQLNEYTFMRMHGMGFAPVLLPGPKTFELSMARP